MKHADQQTPQQPSDEELVHSAQQGQADAFGDLYERHLTAVYRYIYFRVGNVEDAEDLTEIVFLKAWKALDNYSWRGLPFLAWLYRIAHNQVVDFRRQNRAQFIDIDTQFDLLDETSAPEIQVADSVELRTVLESIQQLEPLQQEVITLRFLMGLSHKETAKILGRNVGAVRVMQHRSLQALRRLLK